MTKRQIIALAVAAVLLGLAVSGLPVIAPLARLVLIAWLVLVLGWAIWRLLRRSLWKVGRRLAFSYFLIGVVPIPLLALLLAAAGYLLTGFLIGHLYHDAVASVASDLGRAAEARLAEGAVAPRLVCGDGRVVCARYRNGLRVAGDERLPAQWPGWADGGEPGLGAPGEADEATAAETAGFFADPTGAPTLAAAAGDRRAGVLALWVDDLEAELRDRSDLWVDLTPAAAVAGESPLRVQIGTYEFALQTSSERPPEDAARTAFFAEPAAPGGEPGELGAWDRPILWWSETPGPLRALDGTVVAKTFPVTLNANLRSLRRHLFSTTAEFDAKLWGALFVFGFLLFDVYVVAALMAAVMIVGLSRAVNRLSRATQAVAAGDFSVRIPEQRRDQVGALQRSFNRMAAELENLVATATEKELLEKELALARDLQQSLIPHDLPAGGAVEFSLLFAPSAAIGGDYFDVFRIGDERLAVVVADVSGHGLSTGLRMAMIKAALTILVEERRPADEILRRLHGLVRGGEDRMFVTATLALIDPATGEVDLTNAGHPPTYVVHDGEVEEVVLPGSPLGGLDTRHGRRRLELAPGDVVVWLSDGLIEATDAEQSTFGYDGVAAALRGPSGSADEVRDRLLAAVERHTGGRPIEDDRTVVAMRWRGGDAGPAAR